MKRIRLANVACQGTEPIDIADLFKVVDHVKSRIEYLGFQPSKKSPEIMAQDCRTLAQDPRQAGKVT